MGNINGLIMKDQLDQIDTLKKRILELERENKELFNSFMNKIKGGKEK